MLHLHFAAANVDICHLSRGFGLTPETYTLYQAASFNGNLYLSCNFSNITEMASYLGITAEIHSNSTLR